MTTQTLTIILLFLSSTSAVSLAAWLLLHHDSGGSLGRYKKFLESVAPHDPQQSTLRSVPQYQLVGIGLLVAIGAISGSALAYFCALAIAVLPPLYVQRHRIKRHKALENQLDGVITSWANALTATPNLNESLQSLTGHLTSPWKEEIELALAEVELGQTLESALDRMVTRLKVPGMDAAVSAALLGKRTGGNLPQILNTIAATLREMNRLEGVLRTKTAEGRNQAWVIGAMPIVLILILNKLNPQWLEPLFNDPIGWAILAVASVLELSAIVLIRKIMAVEV